MSKLKLGIVADLDYASLPLPHKLIVPIKKGKFLVFNYAQIKSNPLRVEKISIKHAGGNRLRISLRGTGQLSIKPGPDIKIGGSRTELEGRLVLQNFELQVRGS